MIGYTARKNAAGKIIHYTPNTYFQTSTNSDGEETVTQIMIDAQFIDGRLNYIIAYDKELQTQD